MITLDHLLDSRDRRVQHQKQLLLAYPGCALICLTVQLPGSVKRNADSLIIGEAGLAELLNRFGSVLRHTHVRDLETGYEAYLLVPMKPREVKKICCKIEDTHPLGRLMDIDVMDSVVPLSRADIGLEPRRCLLCENEARFCMRAKTHSTEELLARIHELVLAYCG